MAEPFSREAEESVLGALLNDDTNLSEVLAIVQSADFYVGACRLVADSIIESHYADEPIDPLTVAEKNAKRLAGGWSVTEAEAIKRVLAWPAHVSRETLMQHAKLVKRHADYRHLLRSARRVIEEVGSEEHDPETIAGRLGEDAMRVATDSVDIASELISFGDSGREFVKQIRTEMELRAQGIEVGVYFGLNFIDSMIRGLRPGELLIGAGEPGVGKSLVWWRAAQLYAERQAKRAETQQMGTLVLSCEMGAQLSNVRLATALTGIDMGQIREAKLATGELERIIMEWGRRKDIPLWFNYRPNLKLSQLRAIVVEAVRRHKVGFVVIDHFRHLDTDRYTADANERDEVRARFLKEQIAESLNVAVVCIAHSTKLTGDRKRPMLSDLRGSGQIAAAADIVAFLYRPYLYASEDAKQKHEVGPHEAEMIFAKNRSGEQDTADFTFDPSTVTVY